MSADRSSPLRIVSLLPSATEIVCALGGAGGLVGVSHECDFPPKVVGRPILTAARVDSEQSSRDIDTAVRQLAALHALSVYDLDHARLAALRPDIIITQDLCDVCAVSLDDVRAAVGRIAMDGGPPHIVSLRPRRLQHLFEDIARVGDALGRPAEAQQLCTALRQRIEAVRARVPANRPRVVSVEWLDPIMLGGTWMPELVHLAGGTAVGAEAGAAAPTVSLDELVRLRPDVLLIKPCGFDLPRTLREAEAVSALARATGARTYVADGNAYFNRPGPRLIDSLELLAACIHPARFSDFRERYQPAVMALGRGQNGRQEAHEVG